MKKNFIILLLFSIVIFACKKQEKDIEKPKLVVGIIIDQMRYDYLTRYSERYGNDGFKRILKNGFSLENAHFNYIPTYTAVGHASVFTGTTPSNHGIISNDWYDKKLKKSIYCVDDDNYSTIGNTGKYGKKSPHRLYSTTIADQLKLAQNGRGKNIGIAIKDRSAILPVGHSADAAYWYDGGNYNTWITSSFYRDNLPKWVEDFNLNNNADKYLDTVWNTLYDIETYKQSIADNNIFEGKLVGKNSPTFPKNLKKLRAKNGNYSLLKTIPAGNTFTVDFAKAAIIGENLGKTEDTDLLTISFSSTDYVGHKYGVAAVETEDTYLRLDKDLANLFQFLDKEIGENKYTLFLTADHAAVHVPSYLQSLKIPAHYLETRKFKDFILGVTKKYFNSIELIENVSNYQIFLNKKKVEDLGFTIHKVAEKLADEVVNFDGIYKAVSAKTLQTTHFTSGILNSLQNGYNQKFSGDVLMIPYPATLTQGHGLTGTSHGSGYSYDTHIPIIFYGNGIEKGTSTEKYTVIDIAPTIANLLKIEAPNATTGNIIKEVLKKNH